MNELKGKKILVLAGVNPIAEDVVKTAKKLGVYTIVTGNLDVTLCPAKRYADEVEEVSTADLDALEKLIEEKKVDGVLTGSSEFGIERVISLCERLGLPFYCNREQWEICSDKDKFKKLCRKNNVPVVPEYYIKKEDDTLDFSSVEYPVIVKPVDGSGGGGISVCNNDNELEHAYRRAEKYSKCGNVIIEKYVVQDEIGINYAIQDGNIMLTAMHDRYLHVGEKGFMRLPLAYVYPSKFLKEYQENQNEKVIQMYKSIGLKNGTLFIQGFGSEKECMFYEMGYRFNGAKQYNILQDANGFNTMEMVINLSLTGKMGEPDITKCANPVFDDTYCTLSILGRPGKIKEIIGIKQVEELPEVIDVSPWYYGGEEITEALLGTQRQILCRVTLKTKTRKDMAKAIDKVYERFDVISDSGESMLMEGFDSKILLEE